MDKTQWEYMRGVVADKALAIIGEYRHGRYHGREVACILGELFETANDVIDYAMLHGEKPDSANDKAEITISAAVGAKEGNGGITD